MARRGKNDSDRPGALEEAPPPWLPRQPNRLVELMRDRDNISYDKVGARVVPPVDGSTIKKLAKGPRRGGMHMTVEWMYRLAAALECHPSELLPDLPPTTMTPQERAHVDRYRGLAEEDRRAIDRALLGLAAARDAPNENEAPETSPARRAPRRRASRS